MARSQKNTGVAAFVPHRWLMLTAAGAATVGLACGFAKPALAEWWKLSRVDHKAAVSKPAPVENGFAGTIRKLTAESRRAAEQGDYAKAEQLAARAAKISEAAAQAVGPQGECSPQETARYLAETRARRTGQNVAVQPTLPPAMQQAQQPRQQPANVPHQQIASTQPPSQPVRTQVPPTPSVPQVTRPVAKPQPATVASAPDSGGPALFGGPTNSRLRGNNRPQSRRPASALPPSPSESSKVDELLAHSRLEAADGRYDQAIALADQAIAVSPAASLFGAGPRSVDSNEAVRWRKHLVAQRNNVLATAATPAKQPLPESTSPISPTWEEGSIENQRQIAAAGNIQTASVPVRANRTTPSDSLWTEELPPAPAPRPKHQHEINQFRRSEIVRQGEWSDAASIDARASNNLRVSTESAPAEPIESSNEDLPVQQDAKEALPEFPIGDSNVPGVPTDWGFERSNAVATIATDEEAPSASKEATPTARPQLRLRGEIQQVAAEFPVGSSPGRHRIKDVPARPEKPRFEPAIEAKPEPQDDFLKKSNSDDFIAATADESQADFPIHRVLELRERLQTAASLDPGASRFDALTTSSDSSKTPPKVADWEGDWQSTDPLSEVRKKTADTSSSKRSSLKLREPRTVLTDDPNDPVDTDWTSIKKSPRAVRTEIVGHSEIARWKSADRSEISPEPSPNAESKESPVSQAGYEAPNARSVSPETATVAEQTDVAPPPPEWYDDGLVRKRAASSAIIRKKSFNMIDQLADALKVSVSTVVSLIGVGGFVLMGIGLVAVRSALKKRHES